MRAGVGAEQGGSWHPGYLVEETVFEPAGFGPETLLSLGLSDAPWQVGPGCP